MLMPSAHSQLLRLAALACVALVISTARMVSSFIFVPALADLLSLVMRSHTPFTDLRQIRADQVAALVHAMCIALGAVAVELFLPFHHVCLVSVFFDEPADA